MKCKLIDQEQSTSLETALDAYSAPRNMRTDLSLIIRDKRPVNRLKLHSIIRDARIKYQKTVRTTRLEQNKSLILISSPSIERKFIVLIIVITEFCVRIDEPLLNTRRNTRRNIS